MTPEEKIEVIRAQAAGKTVEVRTRPKWFGDRRVSQFKDWTVNGEHLFNFEFYEYRVEPVAREFWIPIYAGRPSHAAWPHPVEQYGASEVVHVREVLPNTEDAK